MFRLINLATASALLFVAPSVPLCAESGKLATLEELRTARTALAAKPRRLIANNDGCDCLYFPVAQEPTEANFLQLRTNMLAGSQVGTISYCTISSGFGQFSHNTAVGTVFTRQGKDFGIKPDARNITADLIRQGTDPLKAVTGFAHGHDMESFWSMRMNDTHDVAHRPDNPYFLFPQLKMDHPDWLVGDPVKRTPHGRWSSVDYARSEVRDLAFGFIKEVCENYDVDGVELDFFRHLCYFKSVANGGKATADEVAAMTDLMRRVRRMTEEIGLKRQRPILVTMRLPDSAGFSLDSGLDLATWLKEGLMDILITTDYFRLNPWEHSVKLGHDQGVKVYPALTDPRVIGETRFKRKSEAAYRARAATAWAAGVDGLYLFNLYDIDRKSPLWHELGDPQALAYTDKVYFAADLDGKPTSWLAGGDKYQTIPTLAPTNPAQLSTKREFTTTIAVGDDLPAAERSGHKAQAVLHLEVPGCHDAARVQATLNGEKVGTGMLHDGWIDFPVAAAQVKPGQNQVAVRIGPAPSGAKPPPVSELHLDAKAAPRQPWLRDAGSPRVHTSIVEGALRLQDEGTAGGDYCYYRYAWGADPDTESTAEARVKVVRGANYVIFSNGVSGERLRLAPEGISLYHNKAARFAMDTTDAFHEYRIVLHGTGVQVFVDGVLRLDAPGALTPRGGYPRNEVAFGAANSPDQGEALWKGIAARAIRGSEELRDIALTVSYSKP